MHLATGCRIAPQSRLTTVKLAGEAIGALYPAIGQSRRGSGRSTDCKQLIKLKGNLELLGAFGQAEAVHIAFIGLDVAALEEDRQGFEDGRFAIVITTDDAGHGFVDGNDSGGAIAAKMGELDGLEAHGDFPILSFPENAS